MDTARKQYFRRYIGRGENHIIEEKIELVSDAGDRVSFDLSVWPANLDDRGSRLAQAKVQSV